MGRLCKMAGLCLAAGAFALFFGCSKEEPANPNLKIPEVPPGGAGIKNPPMKPIIVKKNKS